MATPKNNSVIKAFDILRLLAREGRPMSQQQIATGMSTNLSTTNRFLLTLEEIGAIARMPGNLYQIGILMSELGRSAGGDQILTERARLLIQNLAEDLGETVSLTLFSKDAPRKAMWHEPKRALVCRERGEIGPHSYATSIGKLHLITLEPSVLEEHLSALRLERLTAHTVASVEDLRNQVRAAKKVGYAISCEEVEEGLVEVSYPIRNRSSEMIGALTLSAPSSRLNEERRGHVVAALCRTSEAIVNRVFVESYTLPGKARPKGSFPHVKRVDNLVFVSGTSSRRPDERFAGVTIFPDGSLFHDTFEQTRETMTNIRDILGTLLLEPEHIVNLEAFLINMSERRKFQEALALSFRDALPAVTVSKAKALPHPHQAVMIKAVARFPDTSADTLH
ncbi:MAG: IclR family transcriptional regulator C-terminal domain-containing protein [Pseudomonadota bacterium]